MSGGRIDNHELVRAEYRDDVRLTQRFRAFREFLQGTSPEQTIVDVLVDAGASEILEVGCGNGSLSQRIAEATGQHVVALDFSPNMVELARSRGVDAHVGDVESLAFADDSFDAVVASWMLYHAPDIDQAVREVRRVLRPSGVFIASTFDADETLAELWDQVGDVADGSRTVLGFSADNGEEVLRRSFNDVCRFDICGEVVFPNWQTAHEHIAATLTRAHLADRLPKFDGELHAGSHHVVFVAS